MYGIPTGAELRLLLQFKDSEIPPADWIEEHPERRPHIWCIGTAQLRIDAPLWLRCRGGVVVYQGVEDKSHLLVVPRSLRLEHMPGWHAPFRQIRHPYKDGDMLVPVDWIRLDRGLDSDDYCAAMLTTRKAFCRKWNDNDHLFDIVWDNRLWNPDPRLTQDQPVATAELCHIKKKP